jgi:hypothetical protein
MENVLTILEAKISLNCLAGGVICSYTSLGIASLSRETSAYRIGVHGAKICRYSAARLEDFFNRKLT